MSDDQEAMMTLPRVVVVQAISALRYAKISAVAHYSNAPYPDDPRWTPWTRFGSRVAARCETAEGKLCDAVLQAGPSCSKGLDGGQP